MARVQHPTWPPALYACAHCMHVSATSLSRRASETSHSHPPPRHTTLHYTVIFAQAVQFTPRKDDTRPFSPSPSERHECPHTTSITSIGPLSFHQFIPLLYSLLFPPYFLAHFRSRRHTPPLTHSLYFLRTYQPIAPSITLLYFTLVQTINLHPHYPQIHYTTVLYAIIYPYYAMLCKFLFYQQTIALCMLYVRATSTFIASNFQCFPMSAPQSVHCHPIRAIPHSHLYTTR